jgi:hypothetical protein
MKVYEGSAVLPDYYVCQMSHCVKMATIGEKLSGERQRNLWKILWVQSARLFPQSSKLGLPQPRHPASLSPPLVQGGGHTPFAGEEVGGGGPNSDEGTDTVVL